MSSSTKNYDVFLSFRGEDTRTNFTSHLYTALDQKSIRTYIDYQLNRGEDVWPRLAGAIEDSHVSVIVFSENYASSKWCLEELVKILQCRKDFGQVVIPVFYGTDPSDIRKQIGSYGKAFAKHERDVGDRERVKNWRDALTEAANISGWHSRTHKDDSQLIGNVVSDVLQKRYLRHPIELKGLVGTEETCKNVELLMNKVRVIGIWGMGGIGKTTIAKVLFAKLFPQYDNVCFVEKEISIDKLLFELLKEEIPITFDMKRLSNKKVFIVLDDVDSLEQLEFLCREYRDLSQDSRLIITTRNRQLLAGRVDWIYKVEKWKAPESLRLFSLEAFKENHPPNGYEDLSAKAVTYAGGVPLALKVLGSYLRSKSRKFWESTLRKLDKYPNETILNLLKVSYDGLDDLEKKIFLDIAFFFRGEEKDRVISVLDACGFEASSGIDVLEDRALITISYNNTVEMHDLIQKMGFEIVRKECSGDPARRNRLRDAEVRLLLKDNKGTDAIEGIIIDLSQVNDIHLSADTFKKMNNLRFLKFYIPLGQTSGTMYLPKILKPFSDKLRYLEWNGYPLESLPRSFCAKFLVEIRMPHSHVQRLWKGKQELDNLEGIDLSECKRLIVLPDLSKASRLKWVNLSGCAGLCALHSSILSSGSLVTLILDRCTNLESIKGEQHLKSLENISVNGCSSLKEFAVSSDLIENLDLSKTGIEALDASIGRLHNLIWLNLEGLRLRNLLKELSYLTSLKELKLSHSGLVIDKHELHVLFDGLRSLQILHLKDCSNLFEFPDNIDSLSKLQELRLDGSSVKRLPTSIKNLQELEILSLKNCGELVTLPELPSLIKEFYAPNCTSLVSVSDLKTFAAKMVGKTKQISFKNSLKLNEHTTSSIMESLHLTMVSAAFHNVLVRRFCVAVHSYNYNSVEVCLPGSISPSRFAYRKTKSSSITIQVPTPTNLLGFIYSVVLSPSNGTMKHGAKIRCQCRLAEGLKATWQNETIGELNSNHVYVWYDPFHCDNILRFHEPNVCFEFSVTTDTGEVDGSIGIQECGVHPISVSELHSVLPKLDLDSDKRKDFEKGLELESGHNITKWLHLHDASNYHSQVQITPPPIPPPLPPKRIKKEKCHEKISSAMRNKTQNQQRDLSEQFFYDRKVEELKYAIIETHARSTDNIPDIKDIMESSFNESNNNSTGRVRGENNSQLPKDVKSIGNEGKPTESDIGLHQPVDSVNEENEQMSLYQSKFQDEADEDPLFELESILFGSRKSSLKAACSKSNLAVREALHNLECLLEKSLENVHSDVNLQQQLQISLECIEQASIEEVSPSIAKLVKSMAFSVKDLFKQFALSQKVVEDHTSHLQQKEKLVQQMVDARKLQELLRGKMNQYKVQAETLEREAEDLDERIRILVEQKIMVLMKQNKVKEALEECDDERKKLRDEAKNWVAESKELMLVIENSEVSYVAAISKQEKLNENWEGFRTCFAHNFKMR